MTTNYRPVRRLMPKASAARIAAVLSERPLDDPMHRREILRRTGLTPDQFRRGVKYLKAEAGRALGDVGIAFVVRYDGTYQFSVKADLVEASQTERLNDADARMRSFVDYLDQLARNIPDPTTKRLIRASARAVAAARDLIGVAAE